MRAAIAIGLVLVLAPGEARADDRWYGDHVLIADGVGWGLIGAAVGTRTWQLAAAGAVTLTLGAPVVHLAIHENLGRAGISLGLRVVGPILGLAVGGKSDRNADGERVGNAIVVGLAIGWILASIVDVAFVAREAVPAEAAPRMISFGGTF
jgi:hypothetical protein